MAGENCNVELRGWRKLYCGAAWLEKTVMCSCMAGENCNVELLGWRKL
jgi:hypothetical protein